MTPTPLKYGAILVDPPWSFSNWSAAGERKNALQHYDCMTYKAIAELCVGQFAAPDCVLFMWATDPLMPTAVNLMKWWGFAYKTVGFTWVKQTPRGKQWHMGLGYWTRANPEMCLLGTIGRPRRKSAAVRQLITAPIREHSRKPDEIYERIEALVDGPYCELFARQRRPGWECFGDEVDKFEAA